jgi:hypothetical protein
MKTLFALLLIPLVTGCELINEFIKPGNDLTLELQINASQPTFQYLIPGDGTWQTVPPVSLTGELTSKDSLNNVLNAGPLNVNGVSTLKTKPGGQTLLGVLRSNQVIAEGRADITPGVGSSTVSLTFNAIINRVVFPPTANTTVSAGSTHNLAYWVFGPLYRVSGVGAYGVNARVSGAGELVASDEGTVQIRVNGDAKPGDTVTVGLTIQGKGTQSPTQVTTNVTLTVGQ